ncbi:MAG: hypothetical protein FJX80_08905 [Bacteroidetes bacterium]|nr:hypothetical protein [Bacteroidota bacterium]
MTYSQSKKEQIEILANRVDSLNRVVGEERSLNQNKINELNSTVTKLEGQIAALSSNLTKLNQELQDSKDVILKKQKEIVENQIEISRLQSALKIKSDSLDLIRDISMELESQKVDTLFWEMDNLTWNQVEFKLKLVLPFNKFEKPEGNLLFSKDRKIKITTDYNYTDWFDQEEGIPLFYNDQDAIDYYSKDLINLEIYENMGFVIKGKNTQNELVIIKGIYNEEISMQGRDEGEPNWLWSNTIILKATVNDMHIQEYNLISDFLIDYFSDDSIEHLF